MRTRKQGVILPRKSSRGREDSDDLTGPALGVVTEGAAERAVGGLVENQPAVIVAEKDHEFALLDPVLIELLLADTLDREISCPP